MQPTHFAYVVEQPGHAMHGADVIIQATDEDDAARLATVRAGIYKAPLRRAVARAVARDVDRERRTA